MVGDLIEPGELGELEWFEVLAEYYSGCVCGEDFLEAFKVVVVHLESTPLQSC